MTGMYSQLTTLAVSADSITVEYSNLPGQTFQRKTLK
jgi:hypothetical protein